MNQFSGITYETANNNSLYIITILPQTKVENIQAFTLENGMKIIQSRMQAYLSSLVFFVFCPSDLPTLKKHLKFGCSTDAINVNTVSQLTLFPFNKLSGFLFFVTMFILSMYGKL